MFFTKLAKLIAHYLPYYGTEIKAKHCNEIRNEGSIFQMQINMARPQIKKDSKLKFECHVPLTFVSKFIT